MKFIQNSLNAGELGEQLAGRTDLAKYFNGCSIISNGIPLKWGGIEMRPGLEHIAESASAARLLDFQFSAQDAMVIELGEEYARFYKDGGPVQIDAPTDDIEVVDNVAYKWNESSSGNDEYYLTTPTGANPSISEPDNMYEQGLTLTKGTVGSLSRGEWDYGNNDALGFNTIYVRLTLRA